MSGCACSVGCPGHFAPAAGECRPTPNGWQHDWQPRSSMGDPFEVCYICGVTRDAPPPATSDTGALGGPCTKCPPGDHSPTRHGQPTPPPVTSAEEGDVEALAEFTHSERNALYAAVIMDDKGQAIGLHLMPFRRIIAAHTRRAVEAEGERIARIYEAHRDGERVEHLVLPPSSVEETWTVAAAIARGGAE